MMILRGILPSPLRGGVGGGGLTHAVLVAHPPPQPSPARGEGARHMTDDQRSGCPINLTLEVVGDKWSLLIIRDMMFGNRRHFRELLTKSEEGISSNILADRLKTLLEPGHHHLG